MKKLTVGILFGGKSAEHEVSLQSARNVVAALDKEKYTPVLIGIQKDGTWVQFDEAKFLLHAENPKLIALNSSSDNVSLAPYGDGSLVHMDSHAPGVHVDVVFPVLHGPFGEDGTIQGLLKLGNVPFVGASVLGSAIGMDKDVMKRLLRDAGIKTARFLVFKKTDDISFTKISQSLGLPLFVKPANLGSSVGVTKVHNKKEFSKALSEAFLFDTKILIEECIVGREIECSVLGNDEPVASLPGEVIPKQEFYSYDAKYIDENGAVLEIPATLDKKTISNIQQVAVQTFKTLCAEGMARVDMFLQKDGIIVVNEINTIPGFTAISMYPKLWLASGMTYTELISRLIDLALERFKKEQKLKTSYV